MGGRRGFSIYTRARRRNRQNHKVWARHQVGILNTTNTNSTNTTNGVELNL